MAVTTVSMHYAKVNFKQNIIKQVKIYCQRRTYMGT